MNISLWASDFIKSFVLGTVLFGAAIIAFLLIVHASPLFWWGIIWIFFFVLSITLMYISPYLIEPLFNKFTPLDNPELALKIKTLFSKIGIKASQVLKIDASKRSSHSNAYFTGIGRVKRIVIFDTLLEKLSEGEILAVLAHEAGHWKKKHVLKAIAFYEAASLALFYGCFLVFRTDILPSLFHITSGGFLVKAILAGFILSLLSFFLSPLASYVSRKREIEADRFALDIYGGFSDLENSLIKLSKDNLSNLYPHPLYVFFYYSHPPLLERLEKLSAYGEERKGEKNI
jgi:STE24 endopeptidase